MKLIIFEKYALPKEYPTPVNGLSFFVRDDEADSSS
jgi:hypothetical protein